MRNQFRKGLVLDKHKNPFLSSSPPPVLLLSSHGNQSFGLSSSTGGGTCRWSIGRPDRKDKCISRSLRGHFTAIQFLCLCFSSARVFVELSYKCKFQLFYLLSLRQVLLCLCLLPLFCHIDPRDRPRCSARVDNVTRLTVLPFFFFFFNTLACYELCMITFNTERPCSTNSALSPHIPKTGETVAHLYILTPLQQATNCSCPRKTKRPSAQDSHLECP